MQSQRNYADFQFVGLLDQMKVLYTGIKALNFGKHKGTVQISEEGFRITVESGKSIQASLYITSNCFSEFHSAELVTFSLDMGVLAECLSVFGRIPSAIKMSYKGEGHPLQIAMKLYDETSISGECFIKTMSSEELMDFSLDEDSDSKNVVFIRGRDLSNIFQELDKSAEELRITLSPEEPYFKISTLGAMQIYSSIEVAKTSEMMLLYNCRQASDARYRNAHLKLTQKAMAASSKVAIKTDASGLLEMHFMIQADDSKEAYIQFYIEPLL